MILQNEILKVKRVQIKMNPTEECENKCRIRYVDRRFNERLCLSRGYTKAGIECHKVLDKLNYEEFKNCMFYCTINPNWRDVKK